MPSSGQLKFLPASGIAMLLAVFLYVAARR